MLDILRLIRQSLIRLHHQDVYIFKNLVTKYIQEGMNIAPVFQLSSLYMFLEIQFCLTC